MLRRVGEEIQDGRYRLLRRIGRGSMGAVFRAYDRQLQIDVVMKFPAPPRDVAEGDEFLVRFERELGTLVHLSHPHIVGILNAGVHEGTPYIVLQYLAGGSLKDMIEGQAGAPLPAGSLRHWLMEIARALDSIHDRHYIHRDVKPANILFDREGNAFLGDFGIVKLRRPSTMGEDAPWSSGSSETAPEFLMGTPSYVAPEAVLGLPVDGRLDQYALAMTVHEALYGRNVMTGPTPAATVLNQTKLEVPPLSDLIPGVSERLSAAVARGLSKDREGRFPTCVAFAREALADFLTEPTGQPFTSLLRGQAAEEGVSCPACGCEVPVGPEHAGERVRCPRCHQVTQVLDGGSRAVLASSTDEFSFTTMPAVGGSSGSGELAVATAPPAVALGTGTGSGSGPILRESPALTPGARPPAESRRRMVVELIILGGLALLGLSNRGWLSPPKPEPPGGNIADLSLVPDRKPVELNIAYSTDQREWLEQAARDFAETPDGRHVKVRLFGMGTLEAARAILGGEKPVPFHAWIPASGAYRRSFEAQWRAKYKDRAPSPIFRADPLATTPLVFAMWESRYDAFRRRYPEVSFRSIAEAMQAGDHAWERITGEIEWGRFKFGHADPRRSNSGMLALIMMAYDYHDKRRGLTRDDIANPGFRDWLLNVEEDISRPDGELIPSTGPLMKAMVQHGPSEFDCVLVYESVAVDLARAARDRWEGLKLTYAHPNLWNEHPYTILNAPWVDDDHREAAEIFLDFLLSEPVQKQALAHGLRPMHPAVSIRSAECPLNGDEAIRAGVQVDVPLNLAQPLEVDVLRDLLEIRP
ncbi:MAG: substrate-binding domain-containing protein [Isosphaeraceae bacterium]